MALRCFLTNLSSLTTRSRSQSPLLANKLLSPFSSLLVNKPLSPVFGFNPSSRLFNLISSKSKQGCYSTKSSGSDSGVVFESFDFKTLDHTLYLTKMARIQNLFPFVDSKTTMRRTVLPTDTNCFSYIFLEACFDNFGHFQLLVSLETASLVGVKVGESLLAFVDQNSFGKEFGFLPGIKDIHYSQIGFNPETFLPFEMESLEAAVDLVNKGWSMPKSPWFIQNVALVFGVVFRGVIFPGLKVLIAETLKPGYFETSTAPNYLKQVFHSWEKISHWYLAGAEGSIKVNKRNVTLQNVTSTTVSLVKVMASSRMESPPKGNWNDTRGKNAEHIAAKRAYKEQLQLPKSQSTPKRPNKKKNKNKNKDKKNKE